MEAAKQRGYTATLLNRLKTFFALSQRGALKYLSKGD